MAHQNGAKQQDVSVSASVAVVVVPFPAQGHLNPLLHLCRRISAYEIPAYFVGSAASVRQATSRVQGCDPSTISHLHLHAFPTPPFENPTPDNSAATSKFPAHMQPMLAATASHFEEPLHELCSKLSSDHGRVVVIFDVMLSTVVKAVFQKLPDLECYCFQVTPASFIYSLFWEVLGKTGVLPADSAGTMKDLREMEGCFSEDFKQLLALQRKARDFHVGNIYHTSRIIEEEYLDLLGKTGLLGHDKHWALGPFIPVAEHEKRGSKSRSKCLEWLDEQPENSVMFVSFGTTSSISDEQIREIALGLEQSDVRFIWSLRDADRGNVFDEGVRRVGLPEGFEERVRERGIVEREWAPQLEILEHRATGGFMSHCGWNSCLETISKGVPVAAWPMNSEQPRNAVLLDKALKIGLEMRDWARRDEVVSADAVAEGVRRLMSSAEGEEMRLRAAELAEKLRLSFMEGGVGRREMDSFIAHITR